MGGMCLMVTALDPRAQGWEGLRRQAGCPGVRAGEAVRGEAGVSGGGEKRRQAGYLTFTYKIKAP